MNTLGNSYPELYGDNDEYPPPEYFDEPTEEDYLWRPMDTAPKDGTVVLGLNEDGTTDRVYWSSKRCCILGRRAGSYPDGWMSAEVNLPVDAPTAWQPIDGVLSA